MNRRNFVKLAMTSVAALFLPKQQQGGIVSDPAQPLLKHRVPTYLWRNCGEMQFTLDLYENPPTWERI